MSGAAPEASEDREPAILSSARVDLDVPGETGRQAKVFALWLACLAVAVGMAVASRSRIPPEAARAGRAEEEIAQSRLERLQIAAGVGLLLPTLLTLLVTHWHRRGGGHARGIVVDVTDDGDLRVWGRGYGSRVSLAGARAEERFVDVYAGRLGAWRQRRLRVRAAGVPGKGRVAELEIATPAFQRDLSDGLRLEGGEGDCVELDRQGFEAVRTQVLRAVATSTATTVEQSATTLTSS